MPGRPTRPSRHWFFPRQLYCVRQHNRPLGWERGVMREHDKVGVVGNREFEWSVPRGSGGGMRRSG